MHEEHSIGVVLDGTENTICRGASHNARKGDVILINAEEVHSNESRNCEYRLIKVLPTILDHIGSAKRVTFPNIVVTDPFLFRRILNLHLKLEQNLSILEMESELISTLALLLERQCNTQTDRQEFETRNEKAYVQIVRDYLKAHYAENVSLSQLTSLTNLSPFYLLRVFRQRVGFPPHEYQTQVRVAHARKLIRTGTPLSQAALETGFFDQSHLTRNFKRIVGVTPHRYFLGNRFDN
jgi:AraC-like DNA-binding protein